MLDTHYDENSKIWCGNHNVPTYNPNASAGHVLLMAMLKYSTKIAQISDNNEIELTFMEMYLKSIRIAVNLQQMGYKQGDVIGFVVSGNPHNLSLFITAALTLGMPVSVLDSSLSEGEIDRLFKISKPKLIICSNHRVNDIRQIFQTANSSVKIYGFDSEQLMQDFLCLAGTEETFVPPDLGNNTEYPAVYACTSGTSGLPKCYAYNHVAVIQNLGKVIQPVTCDDVIFGFSSLYWISGWSHMLSAILHGCTRIITTEPLSDKLLVKIIDKYKVTFTLTAPTVAVVLLNVAEIKTENCSSLSKYLLAGSVIKHTLIEKLQKIMPNTRFQVGYGSTESGGVVSRAFSDFHLNSVGFLENGVKVKILDDDGNNLGINEIGEICTWKNYNFLGYVSNAIATKELLDTDGWIHTGDCGYFDENGKLYVVDRKKDLLKYRNYQISPSEIETIIQLNTNVNNVCVVGVPDDEGNDLAAAFVIHSKSNPNVAEKDIHKIISDKLSDSKQLRGGVYFVDQFPLNISGKVLRRELRDLAVKLYANKQK